MPEKAIPGFLSRHPFQLAALAVVAILLLSSWLHATALFQSVQSPHALKGMRSVQVEIFVNDNGTKAFANKKFENQVRADLKKALGRAGLKFKKSSYDRLFVDVYVMPLENHAGEKLGHTVFMELEVSRGGYFRAAERKKQLLPAETVVWQSSGIASTPRSRKETGKIILNFLGKSMKKLGKEWKKAQKMK